MVYDYIQPFDPPLNDLEPPKAFRRAPKCSEILCSRGLYPLHELLYEMGLDFLDLLYVQEVVTHII